MAAARSRRMNQRTTPEGIAVQFLIAGQKAGKGSEVMIPEPLGEENVEQREGLSVVRLSRLIEMKIACGMSNLRRTHKDFADVVELIAARNLDRSFARFIHLLAHVRTLDGACVNRCDPANLMSAQHADLKWL